MLKVYWVDGWVGRLQDRDLNKTINKEHWLAREQCRPVSYRGLGKKSALGTASVPPHLSSSLYLEHFPISTYVHDNSHFYGT